MNRLSIDSTMLASAAYVPDRMVLELEFRDGSRYRFFDVPEIFFRQLMAAESKGAYFNRSIRNRFRNQPLTGGEEQN